MSDFIKLIRREFEVDDPEYSVNVLDHQYAKEGVSWRLDFGRGHWIFLLWSSGKLNAEESTSLVDDEVLGFLKARFPALNIRNELAVAAIEQLKRKINRINEAVKK